MAMINRIARLFRADFNAVLDRIEEPEALLKQAVRDMEDELADCDRRMARTAQEQKTLTTRRAEVESGLAEIDSQLDLCFESNEEALARGLVRRKLEAGRLLRQLEKRHADNATTLDEQRSVFAENRAALDSLRQKAELFAQRDTTPIAGAGGVDDIGQMSRDLAVADDDVEIAFLDEKKRRAS